MGKYIFRNLDHDDVELTIETYGFHFAIVTLATMVQDIHDWELVTKV